MRAAAFVIAAVERTAAGYTVRLARGPEHLAVHLRPHSDGTPYTVRKGRWALDIDDPQTLGDPARAAIGVLVRALPP